jgi:hypothetical protein
VIIIDHEKECTLRVNSLDTGLFTPFDLLPTSDERFATSPREI